MNWLTRLFLKKHQITIWIPEGEPIVVELKKIKTASNILITGIDLEGGYYEYSSPDPFKYQIKRLD